jgi:hypothetical protein
MHFGLGGFLLQGSFCVFDELAQSFIERNRQLIGDPDPHAYLAQFYRTHVSAMDSSFFGELFL